MGDWNANLSQAYRSLPAADLEHFKSQAASKNSERLSAEQSEIRRAKYVLRGSVVVLLMSNCDLCRHAAEMTKYMDTTIKTWQRQSGWVGWCAMGGLDNNGQPVFHSYVYCILFQFCSCQLTH